jgi:glycosyltransferase involved in cell wall biosynthesis
MAEKAILLAYYFPPDNTSGVQRAVRIAKYLPRSGVDVAVIASSHAGIAPTSYQARHVPQPQLHAGRYQELAARAVQRIIPYNERLDWVPHALMAAAQLMEREKITAIISTSPPIATHIAAVFLKARYGFEWIADFRDPLYGNPGRARRWAKAYDLALERGIFRAADHLVAVTDTVCEEWRARYPRLSHKMHVVWNGFDPEDRLSALPLPPHDKRILAHIGVLYSQRHPYTLVTALDRLIENGRLDPGTFHLRFLGPFQERERFESHQAVASLVRHGCMEVHNEQVPRVEANRIMATSDSLLLIDIVNLSHAAYTVPAKIYDYILMGRPILALTGRRSPVDRILEGSGVPHVCLYHTDCGPDLEAKLLRFFQLPTDPVAPSGWFLENFDGQRQVAQFGDLIRQRDTPRHPST